MNIKLIIGAAVLCCFTGCMSQVETFNQIKIINTNLTFIKHIDPYNFIVKDTNSNIYFNVKINGTGLIYGIEKID